MSISQTEAVGKPSKKTKAVAETPKLARADARGWLLCLRDEVLVVAKGAGNRAYAGRTGYVDEFAKPEDRFSPELLCYVQLVATPSKGATRVMLACTDLQWQNAPIPEEPSAAGDRVRVVPKPASYTGSDRAYDGQLGTVERFESNDPFPALVMVKFDDAALGSTLIPINELVREARAEALPVAEAPAPVAEPERLSVVATVQEIPLADIDTSRNYRKVFDDASLIELAQSIGAQGIMQPVLVRPTPAGQGTLPYQLVYGGRRYRGAQLASLSVIPATVRDLTDLQFAEVQLIENVQRQDVQPSDEAKAFHDLLHNHNLSPEEVALKVGRPVKFVLQRAKLTALAPFWMELLEVGRLPLVAAHELARLPAQGQELVAKEFRGGWELKQGGILSARSINGTINSQVLRQLDKAPWPKDDAQLYPKAGPCTTCPKRSGACRGLFEDLQAEGKADTCLDAGCFATKTAQYVQRRILEVKGAKTPLLSSSWDKAPAGALGYRYWDSTKEGTKGAVQGLMVDGADAGHLKWVLVNKSAGDAAELAQQKKADRSAEIRQGKISEKLRQLLTGHLYTSALGSKKVLETHLDNQIYSELRSQGGPHTVLRFGLVEQMGWEMPEGGAAVLKKLTPASNMAALQAWQTKNVSRLSYDEKLALYFALLGYNCSTFDVHNDRLQKYAKAAGANPANLKKAAEALVDDKGKNGEAKQ